MLVLQTTNAHSVLPDALFHLFRTGERRGSRAGDVIVYPEPVTTMYTRPDQKVVFWDKRDANPYFHFMEALWMLGGRNDVAFVSQFNQRMKKFSDDGKTMHGAYGNRWRKHFGQDQLETIARNLKHSPDCRRQILTMWAPDEDLVPREEAASKRDLPCNTQVHFQINSGGCLDMTVSCRSNDVVWGCYGSDSVTFGFLIEYMAAKIGVPVGRYWQVSDNWHGYVNTVEPLAVLMARMQDEDPYRKDGPSDFPLTPDDDINTFETDLQMFLDEGTGAFGYRAPFIRSVALPILLSWRAFKDNEAPRKYDAARGAMDTCLAWDWQKACMDWIDRREAAWRLKQK